LTVWNHMGKKYMIEKLHIATKKFDIPTRTGILCFRRKGARTGSRDTRNSMQRKRHANATARTREARTTGLDH